MGWGTGGEHTEEYVEGESLDQCLEDSSGWAKYEYDYI